MGYNMGYPTFFLLVDAVPDYIQKTFALTEDGRFDDRNSDLRMVHMGEGIPKDTNFAVIIHNDSQYHMKQAYELTNQIQAINPNAKVMAVPVQG